MSLLLMSACSVMPTYQRPEVSVMPGWSEQQAATPSVIARDWWTGFGSAELDGLMTEALNNNHDLKGSLARIEQARASLKSTRSGLFPSVSASGGTSQTQSKGDYSDSWRAGSSVSYEVDLFGAVSSSVAASQAQLEGSIYTHEALKLVLMGDVASTYFSLLNAKERLRIADDNLEIAGSILKMVEARFKAGADSALEVSQQKSSYESAKASRASLEANLRTTETALAVLLGKVPATDLVAGTTLSGLVIPEITAGIPSSLLERRPDIRSAEASLIAANANIGTARAALYPSVNLGLDWTVAASGFGNPATTALALASSLSAPIFQGGRLEAGVEQATARQTELIESYRQTVLVSFKEVEDALAAAKAAQLREDSLFVSQKEAQTSYELSASRYRAGTIDFQTLLNTQSQLFQSRDSYLQARNARLDAAVTLYKALGGGWSTEK